MLPYLFMVFVFGFASATQYDQSFFPQNARKKLNDLKKFGTWIQECNGNPNNTLLHFPIEKVPSVCDSLERLGFRESTPGDCSRPPLVCHQTQDKIQWTNHRRKDHFNVDFDSDIMEVETTFSENSSVTLKAGSGEVIQLTKTLNTCRQKLSKISDFVTLFWDHWTIEGLVGYAPLDFCGTISYTFGLLKTKTAVYEYIRYMPYQPNEYTKLNLPSNVSQVEVVQEEAYSFLTKMNHSQTESLMWHPNELDNLHRISKQLKDHNIWNCDLLNDCQEHSIPTSGRLNITNTLTPKTKIYFRMHLQSLLRLLLIQNNGQSHLITFQRWPGTWPIRILSHSELSIWFMDKEPQLEEVLVVLQESVMFIFTNVHGGARVFEFPIDHLIIERIQSFQIEPNDKQTTKTILISSPIEPKPRNFNPKSESFSLLLMLFAPLFAIILICLPLGVYLLRRRKRSRNAVIVPKLQDRRNSTNSGYEDIQCDSGFVTRGEGNNEEDYHPLSNIDYYTT